VPNLIMQRVGSIFWLCLAGAQGTSGAPLRSPSRYPPGCVQRYAAIYHPLLARGIYLAPSGFEVGFISTAHTSADIATLASAISAVCAALPP
jgi:glutamate-1-semialdehyde 2,1-aminomutase